MSALIIVGLLAAAAALYAALVFNRLVALKNHIRDARSNIDTELKRRYDLIPNLVATVRGYAAHERDVLERVTALRARCAAGTGTPRQQTANEVDLVAALQRLMAVVERYPTLKADAHFLDLQRELIVTEDRIQAARRFYNGNVRDYRNLRERFPSNAAAWLFGFPSEPFFDLPPAVREVPDAGMADRKAEKTNRG